MSSDDDDEEEKDDNGGDEPPKMHYRTVMNVGGINRVRSCPQQPGVVAVWCDNGQVKLLDGTKLLKELAEEVEPSTRCDGVGRCERSCGGTCRSRPKPSRSEGLSLFLALSVAELGLTLPPQAARQG